MSHRALRLLAVAAVFGCADSGGGGGPDQVAGHQTFRSSLDRDRSPSVSPEQMGALAEGNHDLTLDLYRATVEDDANYLISTLSIRTAFAMVYAGARGSTADEMVSVLRFDPDQARFHDAMNALDLALASRELPADPARDLDPVELRTANAFWGQTGYAWLESYLDVLATSYGAGVEALDFDREPEASRETINAWVEERTREKIRDLLPEGSIDASTVAVLTNALYFKAPWLHPFIEEITAPGEFHRADGTTSTVDFMSELETLGYASGDGWTAVDLPYRGQELSMTVLVPDAGTFAAFDAALTSETVEAVIDGLEPAEVELFLPKFEFSTAFSLRDVLIDLGMQDTFTNADLSGMIEGGGLYVDDAYHQTFIAVNESGTEAAAATAVVVVETSAPTAEYTVRVDRPFHLLIRDRETGVWLFFGRVLDPAAGG